MPKGDPGRAYVPVQFETENRNKRSLSLDLKNPAAGEVVRRLARHAEVVLEGFRPGVAKRLGIDFDALRKANPKLVYCSISGYGQTGPWRERPGHDVNYVAAAGALAFPGPVAQAAGALVAARSPTWAAAPSPRSRSWLRCAKARARISISRSSRAPSSGPRCATASNPDVDPRAHIFPVNDVFETRTASASPSASWRSISGRTSCGSRPSSSDERFATDALRRKHGDALSAQLEKTMKTRTASEWIAPVRGERRAGRPRASRRARRRAIRSSSSGRRRERGYAKFPVWANGRRGGQDCAAHAEARRALARDPGRARLRRRRDRRAREERHRRGRAEWPTGATSSGPSC